MKTFDETMNDVESKHPYKQDNDRSTYSEYNEGWQDACDCVRRCVLELIEQQQKDNKRLLNEGKWQRDRIVELNKFLEEDKTIIEQLKAEQPRWTPVSERLPEIEKINPNTQDYQQYMCLVDFLGTKDARPLSFRKGGKWSNCGTDMTQYVIAWQPLPEAHKGEEE